MSTAVKLLYSIRMVTCSIIVVIEKNILVWDHIMVMIKTINVV